MEKAKKVVEKKAEEKTPADDQKTIEIIRNPTGFSNLANIPGDRIKVSKELQERLIANGYAKIVEK